jgi:hypothetical protein
MFKWLFSPHTPPSPRIEHVPFQETLFHYLNRHIRENKPFSLVHILVDAGDAEKVQELVGGHSSGNSIGVVVPAGSEYKVYNSLERLAGSEAHLRIGSVSYNPNERKPAYLPVEQRGKVEPEYTHLSAGDLLARVQRNYVRKAYGKKASVAGTAVSPQFVSQ